MLEHRSRLRNLRTRMVLETFSWLLLYWCLQFWFITSLSPNSLPLLHTLWIETWPQATTRLLCHRSSHPKENKINSNPFSSPHPIYHSRFPGLVDVHLGAISWGQGVMFGGHGCQESPYSHLNDGRERGTGETTCEHHHILVTHHTHFYLEIFIATNWHHYTSKRKEILFSSFNKNSFF